MGKSQRLFELVTLLSGRRTAVTARTLAEVLEVSERTIYRDIEALVVSGVAVEGEAGVGYRLRPGAHLPPLMFSADEAMALVLGLSMVRAATDPELGAAAQGAERRIRAVLTDELKRALEQLPYRMPITTRSRGFAALHAEVREAATGHHKLDITYIDEHGAETQRIVWPLMIVGWGDRWTILGWCELRQAYRNFRLDRIADIKRLDDRFETGPQMSYEHYLATAMCDEN